MKRYVCIHGHFYQPPRENAWLETVEMQDSAYPDHDWNERVTAECYAPNGASRILDDHGHIRAIVNNYASMSFNFGPTLLAWLEEQSPPTYLAVLDADRRSRERFGRGSALAQAYSHMIMPLASSRDKQTQVAWGIRDFEHRFGRTPEGMWLPETAVDLETLDAMAEQGLTFTVLAPRQAARIRPLEGDEDSWEDVSGSRVDPSRAYLQRLPSGRSIALFFYDGPISQAIAFEGLLRRGENFKHRLLGGFDDRREWDQLVHIATDGETYGHHHRHGEMALSFALEQIDQDPDVELIDYAAYLERHPPEMEVDIVENTSWSCIHGVERWRSDCGCHSGGHPDWNQAWRAPLREALDRLRGRLDPLYESAAAEILNDPWRARDEYIDVILDRSDSSVAEFFSRHARRPLSPADEQQALRLLELQRHAMLMYTSCGWFFDDLSGIETIQVVQYAGRALQLAGETLTNPDLERGDLEEEFLSLLAEAHSNLPQHGDGRAIFEKWVRPAALDLFKVGAHYAISSLFGEYPERAPLFAYRVERRDHRLMQVGDARLAVGRIEVASRVTRASESLSFSVLHFGGTSISCGVRPFRGEEEYRALVDDTSAAFRQVDLPQVLRLLDQHFGELTYSLRSLFRDEQRRILSLLMQSAQNEAATLYRQIHERHAPMMLLLSALSLPVPTAFRAAADFVLNVDLKTALEQPVPDPAAVRALLDETEHDQADLDEAGLGFTFGRTLERLSADLTARPEDPDALESLLRTARLAGEVPFEVRLWSAQNHFFRVLQETYAAVVQQAADGDEEALGRVERFRALGEALWVAVD